MRKVILKQLLITMISATLFANEEVFLSVFKKGVSEKLIPVNTKVITKNEIKNFAVNNVGELLDKMVSFDVGHYGTVGSAKTLRIRNSSSDQVLVLLNGIPINTAAKGAVDLNSIPVYNIDRIEIFYGASSAVYGYNSVAGTINIITAQAKESRDVVFETSYGSFDKFKYLAGVDYNKNYYYVNTNISNISAYGWRENSNYNAIDGYFNFKKIFNNNQWLNFNILSQISDAGVPGATPIAKNLWDGEKEKVASTPNTKQNDTNIYLTSEYNFDKGNIKLGILQQHLIYDASKESWPDKTDSVTNSLNFSLNYSLPLEINLATTLEHNRLDQKYPLNESDNFKKDITNYSLGIQKVFTKNNLSFVPVVRYDVNEYFGSNTSLLCMVTYTFKESKISFSAGNSWRAPTFSDLYWPKSFFAEGNTNLVPEKSYSIDLGYETTFSMFNISVNPFYRNIEDQIRWYSPNPMDWSIPWKPENVDKSVLVGTDVNIKILPMKSFENNIGVSLTDSKVYKKGEEDKGWQRQAYSPYFTAAYNFNLTLPYQISLISDLKYVDCQYSNDGETGTKFDYYTIWNLKIDKKLTQNFNLYVLCNDLLDQKGVNRVGYPQPGRNYEVGLKINLEL
jgi:outer membrane cobalamin receptor